MKGHGILVGYDGSVDADRALTWAAHEARIRGLGLAICTAWQPIDRFAFEEPASSAAAGLAYFQAERTLAEGIALAARIIGRDRIRALLIEGDAAEVLWAHAGHAQLVVLGAHGESALTELVLGSVSSYVAETAPGQVVVVRGGTHPAQECVPGDVVVGYDGSAPAEAALAAGFEEAERHEASLVVVRAWRYEADRADRDQAAADLEGAVAIWREKFPTVGVRTVFREGSAPSVLIAQARRSRLLVVGSRGAGGVRAVLGSVSHAMLRHSPCPVMVVHAHGDSS